MKEDNKLGILIMVFIGIVIGISLLGSISDQKASITDTFSILNESFAGINGTYISLSNDNIVGVSAVRNTTKTLTLNTDYTLNGTYAIRFINGHNGTGYADYTYHKDDYISNSATRSITGIIVLFGAIAIMIFGLLPALGLMDINLFKKK